MSGMRFLPVRRGHVLVELADLDDTLSLLESLIERPVAGQAELVPAARTLLVKFDPFTPEPDIIADIRARKLGARQAGHSRLIEIPVRYDGADLAELAALLEMPVAEIVRRHQAPEYLVAFTGFAPGFAYLAGGDPALNVPRRKTPRTHVPAGAVGLAGEFSGIYPKFSPGGWQLIGTTDAVMFDLSRDPAALLQPGDRVRFVESTASARPPAPQPVPPLPVEGIEILSAALPVLVQDLGRPGQAGQGVSVSGAADKGALRRANRLVGNPAGTPALEIAMGLVTFRVTDRAVMALAGAPAPITVTPAQGGRITAQPDTPLALEAGDTIAIGQPLTGLRSYLAFRGGLDVAPVLGSAASDTLAGIGPAALGAGDRIGLRAGAGVVQPDTTPQPVLPASGETVELDVVLGPRSDWFTDEALRSFLSQDWQVTPQSSRVGIRLSGTPLERRDTRELPSEATLQGSVQVPASGQPVLFLADHPLTGGYPVIATVAAHHLDLAGQIPAGARIRFHATGPFAELNPSGASL